MKKNSLIGLLWMAALAMPVPPLAADAAVAPPVAIGILPTATLAHPCAATLDATILKTYLFDAARAGDVELLRELIARGIEVDARDQSGSTALILAAYHGKADAVQALLAAGAAPNLSDSARGNTALMGALFKGEIEVARWLLADPRTDVNVRNGAGQTAAMFAALFDRAELVDALAERGADFTAADATGETAEGLARKQGNEVLAQRIVGLAKR